MAWTDSRISAAAVTDILNGTAPFDLDTDAFKIPLFNNSVTPDNTVASALYAYNAGTWLTANEVSDGTEWDAGGEPLPSPTLSFSGNVVTFDGGDVVSGGSSATLADVHGCLAVDDDLTTPVADQAFCHNYFGGAQSVTDGVMTVQWAGLGIGTLTLN